VELKIYKDYEELSANAADEIINLVKNKPAAVLCLASGDTPRLTCTLAAEKALKQKVDFNRCTFIGLDEWVGVPPHNEGSCHYFFQKHLLMPLQIPAGNIHLFDALSDNLEEQCRMMDGIIAAKGGIDLMIVGIGMNGHIGFNEPGVSFDNYSHFIDLEQITLTVGKKYFKEAVVLSKGITLGFKHLIQTKKVLLMANGIKKAAVIKRTVEGAVGNDFPASIMQTHPNGIIMTDSDAAYLLNKK
jgi:galactosamine-6-phosphate isomerase